MPDNSSSTNPVPVRVYNKLNKDYILLLAIKGHGVNEIARMVKCDPAHISRTLKPHRTLIEGYQAFKADPAALWEYQEYRVLQAVNDDDIKKARLAEKSTFAGTARDKVRLQRGQSTTNIQALTALITSIHAPSTQPVGVSAQEPVFIDRTVAEQEAIDVPVQSPDPTPDPVTPDD